jgi:hypothetical protein
MSDVLAQISILGSAVRLDLPSPEIEVQATSAPA